MWSVKAQEIHAGSFTLRFIEASDDKVVRTLHVVGRAEGHAIAFGADGDVLSIKPVVVGGEPHRYNAKAGDGANMTAACDAAERRARDADVQAKDLVDMPGIGPVPRPQG